MSEPAREESGKEPTGLIVSLGGEPQPIATSVRTAQPDRLLFVVSSESSQTIAEVERLLGESGLRLPVYEQIHLQNAQDLNGVIRTLTERLREILPRWRHEGIPSERIRVDFTGGTKVMSAALVYTSTVWCRQYVYQGGTARDGGGMGKVLDGHTVAFDSVGPWYERSEVERRFARRLNALQYQAAFEEAREASDQGGPDASYFSALGKMADAFSRFEAFDFKSARSDLERALKVILPVWKDVPAWHDASVEIQEWLRRISELVDAAAASESRNAPDERWLRELAANARRRSRQDGRHDDAIARLYRFLEGLGQLWLSRLPEPVRSDAVPVARLPKTGWEEVQRTADASGKVKLSLRNDFRLLGDLGDEKGKKVYEEITRGRFRGLLAARNESVLAHGFTPQDEKGFRNFFQACLEAAGWSEEDLPELPRLPED